MVGTGEGTGVGKGVGNGVGSGDGAKVGSGVGKGVGSKVGAGVGTGVGIGVGDCVGKGEGRALGSGVGAGVGSLVGVGVGSGVGKGVGEGVGCWDGSGTCGFSQLSGSGALDAVTLTFTVARLGKPAATAASRSADTRAVPPLARSCVNPDDMELHTSSGDVRFDDEADEVNLPCKSQRAPTCTNIVRPATEDAAASARRTTASSWLSSEEALNTSLVALRFLLLV